MGGSGRSEPQVPGLADELVAEAVVWLVVDEPESRSLAEVASGVKDVAGPEGNPFVAGRSGEADALVDRPRANAQPTGGRLDQQHAEPGDRLRLPDKKHRADHLAIALGDPAALPLRIVRLDEGSQDAGDEGFEPLVPAVPRA